MLLLLLLLSAQLAVKLVSLMQLNVDKLCLHVTRLQSTCVIGYSSV